MKKKLKVGFIGMGGIAHTHVPGWQASPYTEVVAGSDVNPDEFLLLLKVPQNRINQPRTPNQSIECDLVHTGTPYD